MYYENDASSRSTDRPPAAGPDTELAALASAWLEHGHEGFPALAADARDRLARTAPEGALDGIPDDPVRRAAYIAGGIRALAMAAEGERRVLEIRRAFDARLEESPDLEAAMRYMAAMKTSQRLPDMARTLKIARPRLQALLEPMLEAGALRYHQLDARYRLTPEGRRFCREALADDE